MRLSKLFGKTLRQTPAEAENVSHQLLLKAGMIHQLAAGVYSYLPLALRALQKIENIIREEMDAVGGQELQMPVLQPLEMWRETERDLAFGKGLFTLSDRRERALVLGPTHEEVITELVKRNVQSYRDLPLLLYQIQTKFRDEPRPRGGLMRVREFGMKDLYSFDTDEEALNITYQKMIGAYKRIYERCGLDSVVVEADSGAIGGKESHEFMVIAESGEDVILNCSKCDYAANVEKAESVKPRGGEGGGGSEKGEMLPMEEVATPGKITIKEVSSFLGIPESQTLKAVFYAADGEVVFVAIRGDLEVNEVKLKNALGCHELRLAQEEEVAKAGLVAGSASPLGLSGVKQVGDPSITLGANLVAGANKPDTHMRNVNYPRDFTVDLLVDIATAQAGDGCLRCGAPLLTTRGIEVGHVFKLGSFFSERMGATFLNRDGVARPILMGCYGIGIGRLLAAAIEQYHDENGIIWPTPIAPYQVHLCPLSTDNEEVAARAESLYAELKREGLEVLFDDRAESPGVKLNDADLLGMPLRVVLSPRTLKTGSVEVKMRGEKEVALVPMKGVSGKLRAMLF
ncbi:MAG: proline--tRNA ligase [Dehalococcoidia bacterium]|nr:MAG: proline--tRNA ligase [Dehalococcoidia bacterium]